MPPRIIPSFFLACAVVVSVALTGCADETVVLIDEGRSFSFESATSLLDDVEPSTELIDAEEPSRIRSDALTELRQQGELGGRAADLLTRAFPPGTRGVPFYVERATVDGEAVWVVIEAIGPAGGPADDERLWILSDDGAVLFSATR